VGHKTFRTLLLSGALGLWAVAGSVLLLGQSFEAQVTGLVKDQSGAVIPGAKLTATNLATRTSYSSVSNDQGIYRFPSLPPAEYRISCLVKGFKRFEQGPVTLQVAQVLELNIGLEPGQLSEQVTVTAAPPPLDTQTATLGQVVTTRSIQNLPLNIRDPLALVALTPGVILGSSFGNGGGNDVGRNFFNRISTWAAAGPARRRFSWMAPLTPPPISIAA
jgi:Carboxypeptidase regulatory-like domain